MKLHLFSVFAIATSVIALPAPQEEELLISDSCKGKKVDDKCYEVVSYGWIIIFNWIPKFQATDIVISVIACYNNLRGYMQG